MTPELHRDIRTFLMIYGTRHDKANARREAEGLIKLLDEADPSETALLSTAESFLAAHYRDAIRGVAGTLDMDEAYAKRLYGDIRRRISEMVRS